MAITPAGARSDRWQGTARGPVTAETKGRTIMDKWRTAKNSTIVRISASAATLIAAAATVGAGWKWF
ncbi:MAG: hypothetical protein H5T83_07500 [Actinotalea sp.]|nr:hypothetical protein [Actinotalea sp.]